MKHLREFEHLTQHNSKRLFKAVLAATMALPVAIVLFGAV